MKLPRVGPVGGMSRLQTIDPGVAARGSGGAFTGFGQAMAGVGVALQKTIDDKVQKEQREKAANYLLMQKEKEIQWDKDNQTRTEYSVDEIPEGIRATLGISLGSYPEGTVPGYIVKPSLKRQEMNRNIQADSAMISDPALRQSAQTTAMGRELIAWDQQIQQSVRGQELYHTTKTLAKYETALTDGSYADAIAVVENSTLPADKKVKLSNNARNEWQVSELNDVTLWGEEVDQLAALQRLKDRDPATVSHLSEAQYKMFSKSLAASIDAKQKGQAEFSKNQMKLLKDEGRKLIEVVGDGYQVDAARYEQVYQSVQDEDPVLARNMRIAADKQAELRDLHFLPLDQQNEQITELRKGISGQSSEEAYKSALKVKALQDANKERQQDAMAWTKKVYGTLPDFDSQNIVESIQIREPVARMLEDNYSAFTGYLTNEEASSFADHINTLGVDGQMEAFTEVHAGFRGDITKSAAFWEQFKDLEIAPTSALAGQLFAEGQGVAAKSVLVGADYRGENPSIMPKDTQGMIQDYFMKKAGMAFLSNPTEMSLMSEAVMDHIAYQMVAEKDLSGSNKTSRTKRAIKAVVGPLAEYGKSTFQTPNRMPVSETTRWLNTMPVEVFEGSQFPQQYLDGMRNGDYQIVSVGKNQYGLMQGRYPEITSAKMKDGKTAFTFSYDPAQLKTLAQQLMELPGREVDTSGMTPLEILMGGG